MRWAIMGTMKSASPIVPLRAPIDRHDGRFFFTLGVRFVFSKRHGGDLRKGSDGAHAVRELRLGQEQQRQKNVSYATLSPISLVKYS